MTPELSAALSSPILWGLLTLYFLPTIAACFQNSTATGFIFFINLFFGWSIIGWIFCFFIGAAVPDAKTAAYRNKVARARDEFYLREQEKNRP